jgi:hypothetical protein
MAKETINGNNGIAMGLGFRLNNGMPWPMIIPNHCPMMKYPANKPHQMYKLHSPTRLLTFACEHLCFFLNTTNVWKKLKILSLMNTKEV